MTHRVESPMAICQEQIQPCGWWRDDEDGDGKVIIILLAV